ncbi:hypothetical protein HK097_004957 [Rhizophlyctis rosea]|uniref:Uncharacterized protein n=1 Tax=Rhizophlyctis rosea TaxID=64517 RepID=A0AAD5S877_9FUNG|nr:hypothetical protein HK097_004957 [Rhizophlyctis rosea]
MLGTSANPPSTTSTPTSSSVATPAVATLAAPAPLPYDFCTITFDNFPANLSNGKPFSVIAHRQLKEHLAGPIDRQVMFDKAIRFYQVGQSVVKVEVDIYSQATAQRIVDSEFWEKAGGLPGVKAKLVSKGSIFGNTEDVWKKYIRKEPEEMEAPEENAPAEPKNDFELLLIGPTKEGHDIIFKAWEAYNLERRSHFDTNHHQIAISLRLPEDARALGLAKDYLEEEYICAPSNAKPWAASQMTFTCLNHLMPDDGTAPRLYDGTGDAAYLRRMQKKKLTATPTLQTDKNFIRDNIAKGPYLKNWLDGFGSMSQRELTQTDDAGQLQLRRRREAIEEREGRAPKRQPSEKEQKQQQAHPEEEPVPSTTEKKRKAEEVIDDPASKQLRMDPSFQQQQQQQQQHPSQSESNTAAGPSVGHKRKERSEGDDEGEEEEDTAAPAPKRQQADSQGFRIVGAASRKGKQNATEEDEAEEGAGGPHRQ